MHFGNVTVSKLSINRRLLIILYRAVHRRLRQRERRQLAGESDGEGPHQVRLRRRQGHGVHRLQRGKKLSRQGTKSFQIGE